MAPSPRILSIDADGRVESVEAASTRETRDRLAQLAWLLDSSIRIPGTRITVGLDALIGLFPFVGDLLGVLFSGYILSEAARLGAPKIVLARMAFNVGLEGLVHHPVRGRRVRRRLQGEPTQRGTAERLARPSEEDRAL